MELSGFGLDAGRWTASSDAAPWAREYVQLTKQAHGELVMQANYWKVRLDQAQRRTQGHELSRGTAAHAGRQVDHVARLAHAASRPPSLPGHCRHRCTAPLLRPVHELATLTLQPVLGTPASRLWNEYVQRYHYLGYTPMSGSQMRYNVFAGEQLVALLSFAARPADRPRRALPTPGQTLARRPGDSLLRGCRRVGAGDDGHGGVRVVCQVLAL